MFKAKKRFIAGAVCPRCGLQDKLTMFNEGDKTYRECVECDFKDEMQFQSPVREPDTRVNRTEDEKLSETRPVKIIE